MVVWCCRDMLNKNTKKIVSLTPSSAFSVYYLLWQVFPRNSFEIHPSNLKFLPTLHCNPIQVICNSHGEWLNFGHLTLTQNSTYHLFEDEVTAESYTFSPNLIFDALFNYATIFFLFFCSSLGKKKMWYPLKSLLSDKTKSKRKFSRWKVKQLVRKMKKNRSY